VDTAVGDAPAPNGVDPTVLDQWAAFPVDRKPRPIVLLSDSPVRVTGFTTGDAKIAMGQGRFALQADLPAAPAKVRVTLGDGTVDLRTITAQQAYDILVAAGRPEFAADASPPPLPITNVALGSTEFTTDRGRRALPAWLFSSPDALAPLAVPALAPEAFWRPAENFQGEIGAATVAADGVTLTVQLPAPGKPCPGEPVRVYTPEVAESATAVAVGLRVTESPGTGATGQGTCVHELILRTQPYTDALAQPLGARVLVGSTGAAMEVLPG
jgi:hypothetical protein